MFEVLSDDKIMDVYDTTLVNGDQNKIGVASRDAKRAIATAQRDKDIREVVEDLRETLEKLERHHTDSRVGNYYAHQAEIVGDIHKRYSAKLGGEGC